MRTVEFRSSKFLLGMLLSPILLGLAWCPPEETHDFISPRYLLLLALNLVAAYPDFLFHFCIAYLVLAKSGASELWRYCLIISVLSMSIFAALNFYSLYGINGLGYGAVVVLDGGHITKAGYIYLLKEGVVNTLGHIGAVCILWCVAFRHV
jgi:hypothetical protein